MYVLLTILYTSRPDPYFLLSSYKYKAIKMRIEAVLLMLFLDALYFGLCKHAHADRKSKVSYMPVHIKNNIIIYYMII